MKVRRQIVVWLSVMLTLGGCASIDTSESKQIAPDDEPLQGGITSGDVRTVASQMTPSILALPEIANANAPVRIKVADFKNSSRFFIDRNLFMKRLQLELNRNGNGKLRFLSNNEKVQNARVSVLEDREEERVRNTLHNMASEFIASSLIQTSPRPVKIAVLPVIKTNMVNMNADSFTAMLRAEIVNAANGKVVFLMPGELKDADYLLTGQIVPESLKNEGIINMVNFIDVIEARIKNGQSLNLGEDVAAVSVTPISATAISVREKENELRKILNDPAMQVKPNVNKWLNVMIIKPDTKVSVWEKMFILDRKISDRSGTAGYILSGEISGMHQRKKGVSSDYLLISVQLTDPESNETIWEDAYEVKRLSQDGIVYR